MTFNKNLLLIAVLIGLTASCAGDGCNKKDPGTWPGNTSDAAPTPAPPDAATPAPLPPDANVPPPDATPAPVPFCGDTACDSDETCSSCSADCGACPPVCGDVTCNGSETCSTCSKDCGACPPPPPVCGDKTCNGTETCSSCPGDCGVCPPRCGDQVCNGTETCSTCSVDCGACPPPPPVCGDAVCNGVETCSTCSKDCGACPPRCGDGTCSPETESCSTCSSDCGVCPPPAPSAHSIEVILRPTVVGTVEWVSFGLPLPVGTLESVDKVGVSIAGGSVPVFVKNLGNWQYTPPTDMLCAGLDNPQYKGVRSVLIQFPYTFSSTAAVKVKVDLGTLGAPRLQSGIPIVATMSYVNDGRMYFGTSPSPTSGTFPGITMAPRTLAVPERGWLACSGLATMASPAGTVPVLAKMDVDRKNFFNTSISDHRTNWDAPAGSWPATTVPELYISEDGTWLYDRVSAFYNSFMVSGMESMLYEGHKAAYHYKTLLWRPEHCPNAPYVGRCAGYFMVKDTNPASAYFDYKYSYSEAMADYYWLTGDESAKDYLPWITTALNRIRPDVALSTERFTSFALLAPLMQIDVMGDVNFTSTHGTFGTTTTLSYVRRIVDFLYTRQNTANSEGIVTGCIWGNSEWGSEGFSPWMGAILNNALLRAYYVTSDARIPRMIAKQGRCELERSTEYATLDGVRMLIPYYGGTNVGVPRDMDGFDPWNAKEHCIDVAQSISLAYFFETDPVVKEKLLTGAKELIKCGEWNNNYWTRTTNTALPKFRLAPWRKWNWWFKNTQTWSWSLTSKPTR